MSQKLLDRYKSLARQVLSCLSSPQSIRFIGEPLFWLMLRRRRGRTLSLRLVRRVLVVRLDEIGDVVMTTPLLRELRRQLPEAWISLVVKPAIKNLVELCPYVNEVFTYDRNTKRSNGELRQHWRTLALARKQLWHRRFDLAIVPRWDTDQSHATFVAYFSGAAWRIGFSEKVIAHKRLPNAGYDRLFTHLLYDNKLQHEVKRSLEMIRYLGGLVQEKRLELWVGEDDADYAEEIFREHGVRPGDLVVAFGTSGGHSPMKQWPRENFLELGRWLRQEYDSRVLIVGGPGEETLGWELERGLGPVVINVVGKTSLRQAAALLGRCHLYAGNDAGPMHVAVAMGLPVVALFGSSCLHRFGPWGSGHRVLSLYPSCGPCKGEIHLDRCRYCTADRPHCILDITVEQVKEAVTHQLQKRFVRLKQWENM